MKNRSKKVLIINRGWSDNLGDQAIKYTLENILKDLGCEVKFCDFIHGKKVDKYSKHQVNNNKSSSKLINIVFKSQLVKSILWYLKNKDTFKRCLTDKAELAIIGGGQLLHSNAIFPIALAGWAKHLNKNGCKIVLFGVGAVKDYNMINRNLIKYALKKIDKIYVRDNESRLFIKSNFNKDAEVVPDVVFSIDKYIEPIEENNLKSDYLISITSYERYYRYDKKSFLNKSDYYKYWCEKINSVRQNNSKIMLFYSTYDDMKTAYDFLDYIENNYNIKIELCKITTMENMIEYIYNSKCIISSRMHPLIIATSLGIAVEPVLISDKLRSFSNLYIENKTNIQEAKDKIFNTLKYIIEEKDGRK